MSVVNSGAILPPHVLLKSDTSNVVDGARPTGTGTRQGGPGGGGGGRTKGHRSSSSSSSSSSWRLSPSDDLPPRPLIQTPTSKDSLPTRSDRDPKTLAALLGGDFDAAFMSVKRPGDSLKRPNGTYVYDSGVVRALSASVKLPAIALPGGGRRSRVEVRGAKRQKMFQTYLGAYTYCPVHYKWIDLGQRFWPRWIRQGDCSGNKRGVRSCSFPAGMSCKPQRSTTKTVLWWHCQSPGQCQWIPIKYPVISSCKCAC